MTCLLVFGLQWVWLVRQICSMVWCIVSEKLRFIFAFWFVAWSICHLPIATLKQNRQAQEAHRREGSLLSKEYFPLNWCVVYGNTSFGQGHTAHVRDRCAPLYQPQM